MRLTAEKLKERGVEGWDEGWFVIGVSEQGLQNLEELRQVIAECGCREGKEEHPYRSSDYGEMSFIHIQW
jgi:hypothetical protein